MILKSRVGNIPRILSTAAALENVGAHAHRFYYQFVHILCWKALPRRRPDFPHHVRGKYTAYFVHATIFTFLAGPGRGDTTDLACKKTPYIWSRGGAKSDEKRNVLWILAIVSLKTRGCFDLAR